MRIFRRVLHNHENKNSSLDEVKMMSVFFKRVVTVPAATILLSIGAHAMWQDQDQCQQAQCGVEFNLEVPKLTKPCVSCVLTKDQTVYELKGGTVVQKKQTVVNEVALVKDFVDGDGDDRTFLQEKLPAIPMGLEDGQLAHKGYNCQQTETQVIRTKIDADFGGRKTGYATVTNYREAELVYGDSSQIIDALLIEGKPGAMAVSEFIDGMTEGDYENFTIAEVRVLIDEAIRKLHNGPLTVEKCHHLQQQGL